MSDNALVIVAIKSHSLILKNQILQKELNCERKTFKLHR